MLCIGTKLGNFKYTEKLSFENENEYGAILQFRIQAIYFKVFQCIQTICGNSKLEK